MSSSNVLGSLASVWLTTEDELEEELVLALVDLWFFATVTPTPTPIATRPRTAMSEPMTFAFTGAQPQ